MFKTKPVPLKIGLDPCSTFEIHRLHCIAKVSDMDNKGNG